MSKPEFSVTHKTLVCWTSKGLLLSWENRERGEKAVGQAKSWVDGAAVPAPPPVDPHFGRYEAGELGLCNI